MRLPEFPGVEELNPGAEQRPIVRVETRHGTYGGTELSPAGITGERILGIALTGGGGTAHIPDSDGGRLDGDTVYDRAVGPMQFIPSTWARWAEDGALRLSWDDPAGIEPSEVVFLTLDLRELTRIPADAPGRLDLDAASIPRALAHGQALLWSVVSQQDGEDHSITASALLER